MVTLVVGLLLSTYLLFDPAIWLQHFMQLTYLSLGFKILLFGLALGGFACSWFGERYALPRLAKLIGTAKERLRPNQRKRRKQYKLLQLEMRI